MSQEMTLMIESLVVAPYTARQYLLKEVLAAVMLNLLVIHIFAKLCIDSLFGIYSCAPYSSIWFTLQFGLNAKSLYLKIKLFPRLLGVVKMNLKKSELAKRIRETLYSKEYLKTTNLSRIIILFYIVGLILSIHDFIKSFFEECDCMIEYGIRQALRACLYTILFKMVFSIYNHWRMEGQRADESLRAYIHDRTYTNTDPYLCPICLIEVHKRELISEFQCNGKHLFHPECIKRWVIQNDNQYKNCPYCKQWPNVDD